ncbi:MAG: hypothetical protein RIQ89_1929 [Bacteroidota bacterium]|jgi:hypothetical protein
MSIHYLIKYLSLPALTMMILSCKVNKPVAEASKAIPAAVEINKTAEGDTIYLLQISFYSIGAGTDLGAITAVDELIKTSSKRYGAQINCIKKPWGREGEVDYCFLLNELTTDLQPIFIKDAKQATSQSELVRLVENSPSRHKR